MSDSHNVPLDLGVLQKKNKILLVGNPNVGKSIFFTKLTGVNAISSNYAGTTVGFLEGPFPLQLTSGHGEYTQNTLTQYTLIDVPGTYSLEPTSEAEAVASNIIKAGADALICVLDATNLERNLNLALELKPYNIPTVYALNLTDVANRHGITIDTGLLAQELVAPVVETIAVKSHGMDQLKKELEALISFNASQISAPVNTPVSTDMSTDMSTPETPSDSEDCKKAAACGNCPRCMPESHIWTKAKEITSKVSIKDASQLSFIDKLGESMIKPFPGIPIAILVLTLVLGVVVGGGRGLRVLIFLPLVDNIIVPFFRNLFTAFVPEGMFLNILIGEFGIFVISFEWIIALVFPYVFLFYLVFSFLEDSGYLPRISVLFDNIMNKLGMQGGTLIHMLVGYGCAVPAIIGSRAATSRKERIIITAAICFAIPCISQTGAMISLFTAFYWWMLPAMILFSLLLFCVVALVCGKIIKGSVDPLLIEIPNLLLPEPRTYGRKLATRMRHFLKDAEVPMMIAVVLAALLAETGALNIIALYAQPLVSRWLGMPPDAVVALILGIVRREMSVAPLLALNLTPLQAFVGGVVSLIYLPCLSVFAILAKEFKFKVAVMVMVSTITLALFTGGIINHGVRLSWLLLN